MRREESFRSRLIHAVGTRVARERNRATPGRTQSELAASVGVSRAAISAFEAGRQGISLVTLCRIAVTLGVSPSALLPGSDELRQLLAAPEAHGSQPSPHEIVDRFVGEDGHG